MPQGAGRSVASTVTVRDATEADFPRMLQVQNAVYPEYPETLEELHAWEAQLHQGGYVLVRAVAETPSGDIAGVAHYHHMPWQFDPTRYRLGIDVHPAWRLRGIGSALYEYMLQALGSRGARAVESSARESAAEAVAFLEHRGFRQTLRTWEMRLDLSRFDPDPFSAYVDRARLAGVVITTLAEELGRDPDAVRRTYELHIAVSADIPAPIPYTPPPIEQYIRVQIESPRAIPEAYFLAKVGDTYVGEANLHRPQAGRHLYHNVTGVLPAYRGRGIAMALKLATIAYGQTHGHTEVRTWNEEHNTAILAINDRLGFVRQPAWLTFEKTLPPAHAA